MSYLDTKILMPELPTTPIFGVGTKRFEEPPADLPTKACVVLRTSHRPDLHRDVYRLV
jgi:hypothetical protein